MKNTKKGFIDLVAVIAILSLMGSSYSVSKVVDSQKNSEQTAWQKDFK